MFHIVWFTDTEGVTTGKNYEATNPLSAIIQWQQENQNARFAVMYTPEVKDTAKVQRDNVTLVNNNSNI